MMLYGYEMREVSEVEIKVVECESVIKEELELEDEEEKKDKDKVWGDDGEKGKIRKGKEEFMGDDIWYLVLVREYGDGGI